MSALRREWVAFIVFANLTVIVVSIFYTELYQDWTMYLALVSVILLDILAVTIHLKTRG